MKITFRKETAVSQPALLFCWQLQIVGEEQTAVSDLFIPELCFDFFYVQEGGVAWRDEQGELHKLPQQALKTLHKRPLTLDLTLPLIIYGARLSLAYSHLYWQSAMPANAFFPKSWIKTEVTDLAQFAQQVRAGLERERLPQPHAPLLNSSLAENDNLAAYSPRHKRRLIKARYGLSLKEMEAIDHVQQFLRQSCDFEAQTPRIIDYVHDDFYDQPHLNNAFKRVTGLAPLTYFETPSLIQDNLMSVSYNKTAVV